MRRPRTGGRAEHARAMGRQKARLAGGKLSPDGKPAKNARRAERHMERGRDRKKQRAERVDRARRGRRPLTCGWSGAATIALVACAAWLCS